MIDTKPVHVLNELDTESILLTTEDTSKLYDVYTVLLGRILVKGSPKFAWMKKYLPHHIPHAHQDSMSTKSKIFPLPLLFKNEIKHDDCIDILDSTVKDLTEIYNSAYGELYSKMQFQIYNIW